MFKECSLDFRIFPKEQKPLVVSVLSFEDIPVCDNYDLEKTLTNFKYEFNTLARFLHILDQLDSIDARKVDSISNVIIFGYGQIDGLKVEYFSNKKRFSKHYNRNAFILFEDMYKREFS